MQLDMRAPSRGGNACTMDFGRLGWALSWISTRRNGTRGRRRSLSAATSFRMGMDGFSHTVRGAYAWASASDGRKATQNPTPTCRTYAKKFARWNDFAAQV